ncbi:MAG TPA: hypothetical protein VIY47_13040 [Ignavibacteriaceae bacterium]
MVVNNPEKVLDSIAEKLGIPVQVTSSSFFENLNKNLNSTADEILKIGLINNDKTVIDLLVRHACEPEKHQTISPGLGLSNG